VPLGTLIEVEELTMASRIGSWLQRHWALVLAGLLVVFIAGGASMSRLVRNRPATEPPAVSAPAP
jgi:hypothetical protein